jgi:hypothetical protein
MSKNKKIVKERTRKKIEKIRMDVVMTTSRWSIN